MVVERRTQSEAKELEQGEGGRGEGREIGERGGRGTSSDVPKRVVDEGLRRHSRGSYCPRIPV